MVYEGETAGRAAGARVAHSPREGGQLLAIAAVVEDLPKTPKPRKGSGLSRWGEQQSGTCHGPSLHVACGHLPTTPPEGNGGT